MKIEDCEPGQCVIISGTTPALRVKEVQGGEAICLYKNHKGDVKEQRCSIADLQERPNRTADAPVAKEVELIPEKERINPILSPENPVPTV